MPAYYPLDLTGLSIGNLIPNEVYTLTEVNAAPYRIIIPSSAPFYVDNFALVHYDSVGVQTLLVQDVDYYLCLPYIGATRSIGKMIYGGIAINNDLLSGTVKVTYQTLGGDWVANADFVRERLIELIYNPKITIWDIVTDKPNQFPPTNHQQALDTVYGQQMLIDAINSLASQIGSGSGSGLISKELIGLGNVVNLPLATQQEIDDLVLVDKYITLKQVIPLIKTLIATSDTWLTPLP